MIEGAYGIQGCGKTMYMALRAHYWASALRLDSSRIFSNVSLPYLGVKQITEAQMIATLQTILDDDEPKLVFISEADRIFNARDWKETSKNKWIMNLWQDMKSRLVMVYDAHITADKVIRDATMKFFFPHIENGWLYPYGFDKAHMTPFAMKEVKVQDVIDARVYDRWERCK